MFQDARQIPGGETLDTDICIIGAGAAGITLAHALAGSALRICLLESGGRTFDRRTQALYRGESVGRDYELDTTRTRYLGGSTNCWGGWCCPLDPIDFEARDWVPRSGWPFPRATLEPYFPEALDVCGLSHQDFDPVSWEARVGRADFSLVDLEDSKVVTKVSQLSPHPYFGESHRAELESAENLQVLLYANVTEIEVDEVVRRAVGVAVQTLQGNRFRVAAKAVVVACGAIENARLLLLSNRVAAAGLGNAHDLVGRFFMEHPSIPSGTFVPRGEISIDAYDANFAYFHFPVVAHLHLTPEAQREARIGNYKTYISSLYAGFESESFEALKHLYRTVRRGQWNNRSVKDLGKILFGAVDVGTALFGRRFRPKSLFRGYRLLNLVEPYPNPDSRVTLSGTRDALGLSQARLDWRLSEADRRTLLVSQKTIDAELRRLGLGHLEIDLDPDEGAWPDRTSWVWHHIGTTRMHRDPKEGVVDPDCLIHGMANLFVAGSSVFPTAGADTPTVTIVALALRLAEHLKAGFAQGDFSQ